MSTPAANSRRIPFIGCLLIGMLFVASPGRAQDGTLLANVSGEIVGTVSNVTTTIKADNATFKSGFIGAKLVIEVTDIDMAINVVDPSGNVVRSICVFDTVTRIPVNARTEQFLAIGSFMAVDGIPNAKLGIISFTDASLFGTIRLDTNGDLVGISASFQATGDADEGSVIFSGKVKSSSVFSP